VRKTIQHPNGGLEPDGMHHYTTDFQIHVADVRNCVDSRLYRRGGDRWVVALTKLDQWDGRSSPTLVEIWVSTLNLDHEETVTPDQLQLKLTTGEVRSLAAGLVHAAERAGDLRRAPRRTSTTTGSGRPVRPGAITRTIRLREVAPGGDVLADDGQRGARRPWSSGSIRRKTTSSTFPVKPP
jgi:hypothetical protein